MKLIHIPAYCAGIQGTLQSETMQDPSVAGVSVVDVSSKYTTLFVGNGSTVALGDCTFTRNFMDVADQISDVISANAIDPESQDKQEQSTILTLQQIEILRNSAINIVAAITEVAPFPFYDAAAYSDKQMDVYCYSAFPFQGTTLALKTLPSSSPGINVSRPWFLHMQEVWNYSFTNYVPFIDAPSNAESLSSCALA